MIFHCHKDLVFPFYHHCKLLFNFSKRMLSQPWLMEYVLRTVNKLFLSVDLSTFYESTNSTIHLPFCREWYRGNKFSNIQRRLLINVTPSCLLCSYLLDTHLQAGSCKEDDSMCLAPQVDTNGCNLACR